MATEVTLTPGRAILSRLETESIKTKLIGLPGEIHAARQEEAQARQALEEAKQALALREAELMAHITSALDDKGKPAYSNAEARAAALARAKASDSEYQAAAEAVRRAQQALENAEMRRRYLEEQFAALRTLARLTTAEILILAGDGQGNGEV